MTRASEPAIPENGRKHTDGSEEPPYHGPIPKEHAMQKSDAFAQASEPLADVPEWAWKRLVELENAEHVRDPRISSYGLLFEPNRDGPINRAFARHIAAHEQPPVDPLREIAASLFTGEDGRFYASDTMIDEVAARLRARLPAAAVAAIEGEVR